MLRKRACGADGKKFRRDPHKSRKQKLFAIELRTEARHGMKQTARESPTGARAVVRVRAQITV